MKCCRLIVLTLSVLLLCSCVNDDVSDPVSLIRVGDLLPQFSVDMSDGRTVTSEDLRGSRSLIVFFNTVCADCRQELPVIEGFHRMIPSVEVVCIARDEKACDIERYWRENGLTLPYSPQPDRRIYNLFASEGIPRLYAVDTDLRVIAVFNDRDVPSSETLFNLFSKD